MFEGILCDLASLFPLRTSIPGNGVTPNSELGGALCHSWGFSLKESNVWGLAIDMQVACSVNAVPPFNIRCHYKKYLYYSFQGAPSDLVDRVYNEYIGVAENRAQVRDGLLDSIADPLFVFSAVEVARHHRGESLIQHQLEEM